MWGHHFKSCEMVVPRNLKESTVDKVQFKSIKPHVLDVEMLVV